MGTASELFAEFLGGDDFGPLGDFYFEALPAGEYEKVALADLPNVANGKNKDIKNCFVWYPKGALPDVQKMKISVINNSPNCTFYFLRFPRKMTLRLNGPNHSVLNLSAHEVGLHIRMTGGRRGCKVIVGEMSYVASGRAVLLDTDLIIMKGALWSDEILVQGSNQHGIFDLSDRALIDYGRNRITLEPHVWVGRRAILMPGTHIEAGAIVGTGAVATKRYPKACIVAGNPGKIVKRNKSWAHKLSLVSDREHEMIDQYVAQAMEQAPAMMDRARGAMQSLWVKAAAAGAAGAAIFEGMTEVLAMVQ